MLGTRRNLLFRASIVISVAMLLYTAMHLSATPTPGVVWMPITADGAERSVAAELRYLNHEELRNSTDTRPPDFSLRTPEESTSSKTPSTVPTTNKTASSTASIGELEKKFVNVAPSEIDMNETAPEVLDENVLTETTLLRLRSMLACNEKGYSPKTIQRGEFWVLKNYVRADHGPILCHETITYTTHSGFEFLDNVQPVVER